MIDILSWTRSNDDDEDEVLVIEEELSEYESFHILDDNAEDGGGRQPLLQSLLSSSREAAPDWTSLKANVGAALQSVWGKRPTSQVLQKFALHETTPVTVLSSLTFWENSPADCPTPTSSNRTTLSRWGSSFLHYKSSCEDSCSGILPPSREPPSKPIVVELVPIRTPNGEEEIHASLGGDYDLLEDHDDDSTTSDSGCCRGEEGIFFIPPPFPLRRV